MIDLCFVFILWFIFMQKYVKNNNKTDLKWSMFILFKVKNSERYISSGYMQIYTGEKTW